jgi:hypothetical protein
MTHPVLAARRLLTVALLVAALLVFASRAEAGGAKYATPQEVFNAVGKAAEKEDWKTMIDCYTDDTRDLLAGGMVVMVGFLKAFADFDKTGKIQEQIKVLEGVLQKHGLTADAIKQLGKVPPDIGGKDREAALKVMRMILTPVKDRTAFLVDFFNTAKKLDSGRGLIRDLPLTTNTRLEDVKIAGDRATGVVVSTKQGKEKRDPLEFRKVGGSWKIDLPDSFGKGGAGAQPLPPGAPRGVELRALSVNRPEK